MGEVEQTVTGRREAEKTITRSANKAALKDRRLNQGLGRATANAEAQTGYTRQGNGTRKRKAPTP
jgi:hypothetical protein